jgi:hypothetical protein
MGPICSGLSRNCCATWSPLSYLLVYKSILRCKSSFKFANATVVLWKKFGAVKIRKKLYLKSNVIERVGVSAALDNSSMQLQLLQSSANDYKEMAAAGGDGSAGNKHEIVLCFHFSGSFTTQNSRTKRSHSLYSTLHGCLLDTCKNIY